ncbi:MAG: SUMF1/EgtB/PvdO family nonheme iron enzyme, partial [Deltaproteobacteria bacterium]|nr:SUMF1/EgtB/PvdO family nonheme iron enzyme [Deltaproteobacteria bacterium]
MRRDWVVPSVVSAFVLVGATGVARADEKDLVLDLGATTLELRQVPRGTFMMGSPGGEGGHEKEEEPQHQVTIARELWVGKTPVTRGQFAKFVADTHYVTEAEKGQTGGAGWDGKELKQKKEFTWKNPGFTQAEDHPVVMVTFGDATAFASWASRKTGKRVRLPTEAEWEYAARAGSTTAWYAGNGDADAATIGWFKTNAGWTTHPVGQKKANAWGLFDLSGNTFEWCRDHYAPYREAAAIDPEQTATGEGAEKRVLRGGSWMRDVKRSRSAARKGAAPGTRSAENGFRVVVIGEDAIGPAVQGGPGPDFFPVAPLGANGAPVGSGSAAPVGSAGAGAMPDAGAEGRPESVGAAEPLSWTMLVVAPLAAAAAVVAWMMLRPKRGMVIVRPSRAPQPARAPQPSRMPQTPPAPPPRVPESSRMPEPARVPESSRTPEPSRAPAVAPPLPTSSPLPTSTAHIPITPPEVVESVPLVEIASEAAQAKDVPSATQKLSAAASPSATQKLAPAAAPSETLPLSALVEADAEIAVKAEEAKAEEAKAEEAKVEEAKAEEAKVEEAKAEEAKAEEAKVDREGPPSPAPAAVAPAVVEGPPSPPAPAVAQAPMRPPAESAEEIEPEEIEDAPPPVPAAPGSARQMPPPVPSSKTVPPAPGSSGKDVKAEADAKA